MKKKKKWWGVYFLLILLLINLILNSPYFIKPTITKMGCPCKGISGTRSCNTIMRPQIITILLFTLEIRCRGTEYIVCTSGAIQETYYEMDKGCSFNWYFLKMRLN